MPLPKPPGPTASPLRTTRRFGSDPLSFLSALEAAYPDVAAFRYGPATLYAISDPTAGRAVLDGTGGRYAKLETAGDDVEALLGSGLLLSEGEQWRRHRRLAEPWFARNQVAEAVPRMAERTRERVAAWDLGRRVDVYREMSALTLSVLCDVAFGVSLPQERLRRLREALVPVGTRFEPDPLGSMLPDWLPRPGDREFRESVRTLESIVDEVVDERRRTADGDDERFLDALLRAREEGAFSRAELRDELVTFLLAGHDTTALTLTYAWYLLAHHPAVDARLAEEATGRDGPVTSAALDDLGVAGRVVREALRLYPPAWLLLRRPTTDVSLAGYRVPAGATLLLSPWAIHRSDRWYESPETFDPARWTAGRAPSGPAYLPFGAGPRTCVGRQFALVEARVVLTTVAETVRLVDPPDALDLRPTLTLHPADPVELAVERR